MKKNKSGLSLVIAISITLVMSLLALYILEYMIPFGKNTKNIEQSVAAYYQADSGIEEGLYQMKLHSGTLDFEYPKQLTGNQDYGVTMFASGTVLPRNGEGNSEFDKNFNIIRIGEPIQIEIGKDSIDPANFKIYFKIPDIDKVNSESLSGSSVNKIVNWQLSGETDVLNASGSQVNVTEINLEILLKDRVGLKLDDTLNTFSVFYSNNCGVGKSCKLKLSVINKLEGKIDGNDTRFPYLEWKIDAGSTIPLRYRIIDTTGKSYGFQKSLRVKIPQQTLNEAFDFTVFQ